MQNAALRMPANANFDVCNQMLHNLTLDPDDCELLDMACDDEDNSFPCQYNVMTLYYIITIKISKIQLQHNTWQCRVQNAEQVVDQDRPFCSKYHTSFPKKEDESEIDTNR